jgi:hypothetical protein
VPRNVASTRIDWRRLVLFPSRVASSAAPPGALLGAESRAPRNRFRPSPSARASVGHAPAPDEVQASARARSQPVPLLHPREGSGTAGATEFHAKRQWRRCRHAARIPSGDCWHATVDGEPCSVGAAAPYSGSSASRPQRASSNHPKKCSLSLKCSGQFSTGRSGFEPSQPSAAPATIEKKSWSP